jgi:hypothetical protein
MELFLLTGKEYEGNPMFETLKKKIIILNSIKKFIIKKKDLDKSPANSPYAKHVEITTKSVYSPKKPIFLCICY